jgi:hypothetical protein
MAVEDLVVRLAEWELRVLAPERVPDLAVAALGRGGEASDVAVLAGLNRLLWADVGKDELAGLLRRVDLSRPTRLEAFETVVDCCCSMLPTRSGSGMRGLPGDELSGSLAGRWARRPPPRSPTAWGARRRRP